MTDTKSEDRMCNLLFLSPMWTENSLHPKENLEGREARSSFSEATSEHTMETTLESSTSGDRDNSLLSRNIDRGKANVTVRTKSSGKTRPDVVEREENARQLSAGYNSRMSGLSEVSSTDGGGPASPSRTDETTVLWHTIYDPKDPGWQGHSFLTFDIWPGSDMHSGGKYAAKNFAGLSKNTKWTPLYKKFNQTRTRSVCLLIQAERWSSSKNERKRRQDLYLSAITSAPFIMS